MNAPMPQPLTWDSPSLTWDSNPGTWDGVASQPTHSQTMDNRISKTVSPAQKAAIEAAIAALRTALTTPEDLLLNLTAEERRSIPKIGDKTLAFDEKCAAYSAQRPELVPGFTDTAEVALDRALVSDLLPCLQQLAPLCEGLEDSITAAQSDLLMADLAFYSSVKDAAKRNVPGADTIYNDLKARFPGRPRGGQNPPPTP